MKDFFKFSFSFLYTRNWHTGRQELSQSRLAVFACGATFVLISLILIWFLQAPIDVIAV